MKALFENKRFAKLSAPFRPLASVFLLSLPNLGVELKQVEFKVKKNNFVSISLFFSFVYSLIVALLMTFIFWQFSGFSQDNIILIIVISLFFFAFYLFYLLNYPKLLTFRRVRELDKSLLFALRHMLIKVRSGIPFFNSITGIAYGSYGIVSLEFRQIVRDIEGGTNEVNALEKSGFYNPSPFYRRFIWQITNSLRAGTDISKTLQVIVKGIEDDRYIQIKEFGNKLSPIALMYIMFTIIIPALSITFMTVFASFIGGSISNETFYIIPVILILSNIFFMNIIQSIRPMFEME